MPKLRLCFTVVSEALRGERFSFDGDQPISIGRTADNMLPLDHRSVSRCHARIEADGSGYALVDLGSHNGTRVADKLISKQALKSGDRIGLGEIQLDFTIVDDEAVTEGVGGANLPVVAAAVAQAGALARPMNVQDVFVAPPPTAPGEAPKARRNLWPVIYAVGMVLVVVFGLAGFWAAGVRKIEKPRVDVLLRANESLPVDLSRLPAPEQGRWMRGLSGIERIESPTSPQVADAKVTLFRSMVTVRGKSPGTTDISVYGPPLGEVIVRVVVRGVKPPPVDADPTGLTLAERRAQGHKLLQEAYTLVPDPKVASIHSWGAAKKLDLAARFLEPFPDELANATRASQNARAMRQALNARFEQLAREIDVLRERGDYPKALTSGRELKGLFTDLESEEHHVVNAFYDGLEEEAARVEREAQEKR